MQLLNAVLHGYDSSKSVWLTWKADCYISVHDKGVKSGDEEIKKLMMDSFILWYKSGTELCIFSLKSNVVIFIDALHCSFLFAQICVLL